MPPSAGLLWAACFAGKPQAHNKSKQFVPPQKAVTHTQIHTQRLRHTVTEWCAFAVLTQMRTHVALSAICFRQSLFQLTCATPNFRVPRLSTHTTKTRGRFLSSRPEAHTHTATKQERKTNKQTNKKPRSTAKEPSFRHVPQIFGHRGRVSGSEALRPSAALPASCGTARRGCGRQGTAS